MSWSVTIMQQEVIISGRVMRMCKQSGVRRILKVCKEHERVSAVNMHSQNCVKNYCGILLNLNVKDSINILTQAGAVAGLSCDCVIMAELKI